MLTEQEQQELREFGAELAANARSPWEPRCVARAFRSRDEAFVFTMQVWIDLDAAASPFLQLQLPEAEEAVDAFAAAFRAFGHYETDPATCEPEDLVTIGQRIVRVIAEGFGMRLRLNPPEGCKTVAAQNGLGDWLPVLACLKTQMSFGLLEAKMTPVGEAFALIAAHRCNEGWSVAEETYADRDIPEGE